MSRIAIITDSNSGITQNQAKALGIAVIPMPFFIEGETYFEDINLSQEEFYQRLSEDVEISTSQPAIGDILDLWDNLLETNDEIVYIPMSSGLSGSCSTATALAKDYSNRVAVVNNQRISVTQRQSVLDAFTMAESGKSAAEIKTFLEDTKFESSIYITVNTLKYLQKGGRITPAAATVGTILNLKPVLQIQGEKLDAFSKARGMKQAKRIMLDAIKSDLTGRFAQAYSEKNMYIQVAHTCNVQEAELLAKELGDLYPDIPIHVDHLSLSVACHIGPGSLAIACTKKII